MPEVAGEPGRFIEERCGFTEILHSTDLVTTAGIGARDVLPQGIFQLCKQSQSFKSIIQAGPGEEYPMPVTAVTCLTRLHSVNLPLG